MLVKLTCARVGHSFDKAGRLAGIFAQKAGDEVELPPAEAQRYLAKGMATEVKKAKE